MYPICRVIGVILEVFNHPQPTYLSAVMIYYSVHDFLGMLLSLFIALPEMNEVHCSVQTNVKFCDKPAVLSLQHRECNATELWLSRVGCLHGVILPCEPSCGWPSLASRSIILLNSHSCIFILLLTRLKHAMHLRQLRIRLGLSDPFRT